MASNNSNKDDNKNDFDTAFKDALLLKRQKDRERKRAQRLALTEEKKETIREQDREQKKHNYDREKESQRRREYNEQKANVRPPTCGSARKYTLDDKEKDYVEPH